MKYLLLLAISTYMSGSPSVSVIEFDSMAACLQEKEAIHLWLKSQKFHDDGLSMACVTKAGGERPSAR